MNADMSILDALSPYKLLIEIAVIGSLAAGAVYGVHQFLEHERDIGRQEVRAEYATKLAEAKEAARKREAELTTQRDEAVSHANERDQTIRTVAAGGAAASLGLRDILSGIRNGVPSATVEALRQSTATLATVLADCQTRYRGLAEIADRHASDSKTMSDAWPTNPPDAKK
jgi:hypothetical protein